jgi:hypothetical protein
MRAIKDNDECVKEWKYSQGGIFLVAVPRYQHRQEKHSHLASGNLICAGRKWEIFIKRRDFCLALSP